jgi:hypothetical protein
MENDRWEAYVAAAVHELRGKQKRLATEYGIGRFARWWFDQETAALQFFDDEGRLGLDTNFINIGSYSPRSSTWKWAWCNDAVLPARRQASTRLRELYEVTGMAMFHAEAPFEIDEAQAWELAAVAVMHLDAAGCYRAPASDGGPTIFLAIMSIRSMN